MYKYFNEKVHEELEIMDEQDSQSTFKISRDILDTKIKNLNPKKTICLLGECSIQEATEVMNEKKIGSILIVNEKGKVQGILTERDLLTKVVGKITNLSKTPISKVMTLNPVCLKENDIILYAMNNMYIGGYRHIPIVDNEDKAIGIISIKDVMSYLLEIFSKEISNSTNEPFRGEKLREGA